MERYSAIVERVASTATVVTLIGGLDSGKSTLGRAIAKQALEAGRTVAYLDTDLGQKTIGPPAAVTVRMFGNRDESASGGTGRVDALYFVGSTSPQGQLLPLVVGAAKMLNWAQSRGADMVIVDTSGLVSGVYGQVLKYHKIELLQPDVVIGLQRGEELAPLLGIIQRFFSCEVLALPVPAETRTTSADQRARNREAALRNYFSGPVQRWRIKPSVFMPALPALFEEQPLDRLLVGLSDGKGEYTGLGYLEYSAEDGLLRLLSPVSEAPKALKLGSVRVDEDFHLRRVDLRSLFGTD